MMKLPEVQPYKTQFWELVTRIFVYQPQHVDKTHSQVAVIRCSQITGDQILYSSA
jgi:hypothetical protein